jgi:hypothetical protein
MTIEKKTGKSKWDNFPRTIDAPIKNMAGWLDAMEQGETNDERVERVIADLKSESPGKVTIPAILSDKDYNKVLSNIKPNDIVRFRLDKLNQNVTEGVVRTAKPEEYKLLMSQFGEDDSKSNLKTLLIIQAVGVYRRGLIERGHPTEIPIDAIGRKEHFGYKNGIFSATTPTQTKENTDQVPKHQRLTKKRCIGSIT